MMRVLPVPDDVHDQMRRRGVVGDDESAALVIGTELAQFAGLVDDLVPPLGVVPAPVLLQARRNAEARVDVDREFGLLTAGQVAELVGSRSSNRSSAAHSLRSAGRIFSVPADGQQRYPGFQFDPFTGAPRPVVAAVFVVLSDAGFVGWEIVAWFTSPTGWLDDRRPVDLLDDDPDRVVAAAEAELTASAAI